MVTERDPKTNRVSISDLTPPIRAKVNDHQRGLAAIPTEYVAIADIDDEPVSGVKTSPVSSNWASEAEDDILVSKNLLLGLMNAICEEDFSWDEFNIIVPPTGALSVSCVGQTAVITVQISIHYFSVPVSELVLG